MKRNIIIGLSLFTIGVLIYLLLQKPKVETINVPVLIEVPVAGISNSLPPVIMPIPKKVKPRPKLKEEFIKSDSITKDSLYEEAIQERYYGEIFSDTIQDIIVTSKVQGVLLEQDVRYEIHPKTIKLDTVVNYNIKSKNKLWMHVEGGINPFIPEVQPLGKASLILKDKKDRLYSAGIDTQKNIWIGTSIRF